MPATSNKKFNQIIIYKQDNQIENSKLTIVKKIKMDQIQQSKCQVHKDYQIEFACLSQKSSDTLACQICMLKNQLNNSFISISQVIKNKVDQPIQNWPLGIQQDALDFLSNHSIVNKKEQIKSKILIFYKDLTSQILNLIEESQIRSLKSLEDFQIGQNDLMKYYNDHFKRSELNQLFQQKQDSFEEKFQLLLGKIEQTKISDLNELYSKIQFHEDIDNQIQFDQSQQISIIIQQLISNINFFSSAQQNNKIPDTNINQDIPINSFGNIITNSLSKFSDLKQILTNNIRNLQQKYDETKQQTDKFLQQIQNKKEQLRNNQSDELIKLINQARQDIQTFQYDLFNEDSNRDNNNTNSQITQIISQYKQLSQQQKDNLDKYVSINKESYLTNNIFQDILILSNKQKEDNQNLKKQFQQIENCTQDMQLLIQNIFEYQINPSQAILNLQQKNNEYSNIYIQLINQELNNQGKNPLNLIKSKLNDSQKFFIGFEQNQIYVTNQNCNYSGVFYSENILQFKKSYIIRFSFNLPFTNCNVVRIGLIRSDKLENYVYDSQQSIYFKEDSNRYSKLIRGNYFVDSQNKDMIKCIEMRVCLEQGIVQYSDYPNYENVLQNKYEIDKNVEYRIGIGIDLQLNKIITITYFKEQDQFLRF